MVDFFAANPLTFIWISLVIGAIATLLSFLFGKKLSHGGKILFFSLIAIPIILASLYMAAHTVHENIISETGGPVHWHVDYQVFTCGERLNLIDPTGLNNKIGSPLFHEHNDDRVHIEGTVMKVQSVDLQSYFAVIGGKLTETSLKYPSINGVVQVQNGDLCNGQESTLNIYVNGQQVQDPLNHVPYPHALVPPGDCVIVEFSPDNSQTTDKVCESWQAQEWNYDNYEQNREDFQY
jgi:hypothetical protein